MPLVRISLGAPLEVGKLIPGGPPGAPQYELPVQVQRRAAPADGIVPVEGSLAATDGSGKVRHGAPVDVKAGQFWVLVPRSDGGFEMRPTTSWYEFGRPAMSSSSPAQPAGKQEVAASKTGQKTVEEGEAELRRNCRQRSEFQTRWEQMAERRSTDRGKVEAVGNNVLLMAREVDADEIAAQQPMEAAIVKAKSHKRKVPLEEERLRDESGVKRAAQKQRRALAKEAKSFYVEDEDAPHSANGMHALKSDRGDNPWDFDENLFSDDEQHKYVLDGGTHTNTEHGLDNPGISHEDAEEAARQITTYGEELVGLLKRADEGLDPGRASSRGIGDCRTGGESEDDDVEMGSCESDAPPDQQRLPVEMGSAKATQPQVPARGSKQEEQHPEQTSPIAAPSQPQVPRPVRRRLVGKQPVRKFPPVQQHLVPQPQPQTPQRQQRKEQQPSPQSQPRQPNVTVPDDAELLKGLVVRHMKASGGCSDLKSIQAATRLKNARQKIFATLVKVLKEVATPEKVSGGKVESLRLKPELFG